MTKRSDRTEATADDAVEVRVFTQDEVDRLVAEARDGVPNPAPAVESGPHLADPELRRLKREQLVAAGIGADAGLTDDLRDILSEEG